MKINEIIAVKLENKSGATEGGKFQHLEMVALSATAFSIYYVKRIPRHRYALLFKVSKCLTLRMPIHAMTLPSVEVI